MPATSAPSRVSQNPGPRVTRATALFPARAQETRAAPARAARTGTGTRSQAQRAAAARRTGVGRQAKPPIPTQPSRSARAAGRLAGTRNQSVPLTIRLGAN